MKLFLASLEVGILVTVFLLGSLLFVRALFPETRSSMGMFWVYIRSQDFRVWEWLHDWCATTRALQWMAQALRGSKGDSGHEPSGYGVHLPSLRFVARSNVRV